MYHGLVWYAQYGMSMLNEIMAHLFDMSNTLYWTHHNCANPASSQWELHGQLPTVTEKCADIVAAIMTMTHNGLVALAQLSTLLPANTLN